VRSRDGGLGAGDVGRGWLGDGGTVLGGDDVSFWFLLLCLLMAAANALNLLLSTSKHSDE